MADFFPKEEEEKQEQEEQKDEAGEQEAPEKIKVGEDEYSQEELESLVGLGKIGREAEEKFDTKIDKVWPNLQKTINEKKELEEKLADLEKKAEQKIVEKQEQGQKLSPEEQDKFIREELKKHGAVLKEDFDQYYQQRREGEKILTQTERTIKRAVKDGKPKVDTEDLLGFMKDEGIRNPETAYKIMFETELDQWKADRLAKAKPAGMVTEDTSTAGGKAPKLKTPQTEEELRQALSAHIEGK